MSEWLKSWSQEPMTKVAWVRVPLCVNIFFTKEPDLLLLH